MIKKNKNKRVRIAPSPTGGLHVGTARTALFNFLYSKSEGCEFILRIEDTDKERSKQIWEENILRGLEWVGIEWDEGVMPNGYEKGDFGPYRQKDRSAIYKKYLEHMIDKGSAFYCLHTKDELEHERVEQQKNKKPPRHICFYRDDQKNKEGIIRFKNDHQEDIIFKDIIKSEVKFSPQLLGDFSIAKSMQEPLYNFAVAVDDYEMRITDIIRGEDHISNTPKQILIQKALGFNEVTYAHTPLLLGTDRSKLSKRHGAVSVDDYKKEGYLPDAMFNFLALLGWRPKGEKEIFSINEIIELFSIEDVQTSSAVFDVEKLNWMNGEYIRSMSKNDFAEIAKQYIKIPKNNYTDIEIENILCLEQGRVKTMSQIEGAVSFAFELSDYDTDLLIYKNNDKENTLKMLEYIVSIFEDKDGWTLEGINNELLKITEEKGDKGSVYHPVRLSVSGQKSSPPPHEIMYAIGKKESIDRIKKAIEKLSE